MIAFALIFLAVVGVLIWLDLSRIAAAIEAQNRHYGIADEKPAEKEELV